jgi:diphthamide synthase (EF-2-diphthine--ammonia ligase)
MAFSCVCSRTHDVPQHMIAVCVPPNATPKQTQGLDYSATEGDEVEDLYCLLAYVRDALPGVGAVASGAIASDFQRLRVEHVCARLGMVSLSYLWHQPQRRLLRYVVSH